MRRTIIGVIILAFTTAAQGQDACMGLLNHGLYDEFVQEGVETQYAKIQNEVCAAYQSYKIDDKNADVKASYGLFEGEASYNAKKLEQVGSFLCSDDLSIDDAYTNRKSITRQMNPSALKAFEKCVETVSYTHLTLPTICSV